MRFEFSAERELKPIHLPGTKTPSEILEGDRTYTFKLNDLRWRQRLVIAFQALRGKIHLAVGGEGATVVVS